MKAYPFSAIVGHGPMRLALLLCAVRPEIGGVLIRGEKGTAKSTAVRGLAALLSAATGSSGPGLVEMPLGATEDRVVGSLDLQRVLRDGEHAFAPGLLARAHGGVLYVDEVNLLHDHLVDILLDAAAMGRVHVERDGISHSHEARFVLIGTMNPEEGELRPQLLDRFGLTVDVHASRDVDVRVEVIRQRMAFEADPDAFCERYVGPDAELARRIAEARDIVDTVVLPDHELRRIAALCAAFDVDGMRADLVLARTATAHAAWRGAPAVEEQDVRVAAELALPHRRRRDPFDDHGIDRDQLDEALARAGAESQGSPEPEPDPPGGGQSAGQDCPPQQQNSNSRPQQAPKPSAGPSKVFRTRALVVPGVGEGAPGRRSRARNGSGSVVAAADGSDSNSGARGLHLFATLLSAAENATGSGPLRPQGADIRRAVREGREGNLVIFVVDASGSMAARDRMAAVSGATMSLLRDAYQRRDKVAVITFRQHEAKILLSPTSSAHIASRRLARFDTGGKTPLAEGLLAARELVIREKVRDRARRPLVVVLTDGRATAGPDPLGRSRIAAARLVAEGATAVVVDCETSYVRLGLAQQLARHLGAPAVRLEQLHADYLAQAIRSVA
ncbi:magnesium chelatase subunit D family protein [Mycobacterium ulcerans]|uniref:Magnesium chelatase n=2 Tax=Mycobacterium ulcerans TaxID=1809 RepID=A0PQB3_MYCUA|nr:magnesium chelatase subunit D family protein [Mycobacterium ulcerans]ABL04532.1 magnesium chelatase [Mycobacterium ulcerans Agy99]MEB3905673.1 magnesium chelatase subunit D family protein [Mycobacterium ulcerans]MEB3909835.1 magnesium chelatase subunit D family protein [Mycobacterium ulcerans]MEB3920098.1 magnesium chelatase subunit D family protein [Mycobacterium ulcerans]MEB3924184.1 magnesium chelatase subunit D family protein [Mycobacterium ulcerans]